MMTKIVWVHGTKNYLGLDQMVNFINYPNEEPVFISNGYRTMFKQFVNNKLYKILKDNVSELYCDRLALLNSLIYI